MVSSDLFRVADDRYLMLTLLHVNCHDVFCQCVSDSVSAKRVRMNTLSPLLSM